MLREKSSDNQAVTELLGKKVLIFDGGMGSELERLNLDGIPEDLNITHADKIRSIHREYSRADIITTDTFGLNRIKYTGCYDIAELAEAAIANARVVGKTVFFDVGPTGKMTEPLGTLTFDEAYETYAEIARITRNLVDGYIVETFSDLYEIKACILALKENSDKPIFATMTFDGTGRTLTGSTPEIAANTLESLGVAALGVNCSLGPRETEPIVARLIAVSGIPVIVQPNRGLPKIEDGKTIYDVSADEFERYIKRFIDMGASVVGGCCGTTPEFISRISKYGGRRVKRKKIERKTTVNSATRAVVIEGVKICGERLNPTGKKKLKEAIAAGDYDYLIDEAVRQQEAGADILDVNVGVPGIDEPTVMMTACRKIQEYSDLPLQIDSSNKDAIEAGVRYYNGVPIINSVNGDEDVMARVFPVAEKYGAAVLGLTMDSRGVPDTAKERFEIAKRIIARAADYGIPRHKIMIDTLVLTASAEQAAVKETAEALRLVRGLGVKTALGVSNVSYGLPNRGLLNKTFLTMAMTCGLNMPIMNPLDGEMTGAVKAFGVLSGTDENSAEYIRTYKDYTGGQVAPIHSAASDKPDSVTSLYDCIIKGAKNRAAALTKQELQISMPMTIVNDILIKALECVGDMFDRGALFLPQLVSSAEAAKIAFSTLNEAGSLGADTKGHKGKKGKVVLATVKGDVHDIGKNIVKTVLQSYGYEVVDLGKDTPIAAVVDACKKYDPLAVGLSALMTTTVPSMADTIKALREAPCGAPIFVGGAVLNAEIAERIGADYYTKDVIEFVKKLESLNNDRRRNL